MTQQRFELSKEAFLDMAASAGLEGDDDRIERLYVDVTRALQRAGAVYDVDTAGVEPSPVDPQFDLGPGEAGA
jgi:hypothetical protein